MAAYRSITLGGIDVCYSDDLDGGGARYGQDYVRFVSENFEPRRRVFEWCAGPGFIGFSLLGHGLADTLCLSDVNPAAVEACRETIRRNGLGGVVDVYLSDGLAGIPEAEKWDLVVANPPHSGTDEALPTIKRPTLIYQDVQWNAHRQFYAGVGQHLTPDAHVVIQENSLFSSLDTFRDMVEANGLRIVGAPQCDAPAGSSCYFYVWSAPVS